jgi:hypothetical protein
MLIERGGNRRVTVRTLAGLTHVFNRPAAAESSPAAVRADPIVGQTGAQWIVSVALR